MLRRFITCLIPIALGTPVFAEAGPFFTSLGDLPGGSTGTTALGLSADGRVVVGQSPSQNGLEAFRWENGVMLGLGDLPGGYFSSSATAVSADGSVAVGASNRNCCSEEFDYHGGDEAFRWTDATGMVGLGDLNGQVVFGSVANVVSGDGSLVAGVGHPDSDWNSQAHQPFVWTQSGGMTGIAQADGGGGNPAVMGASFDGSVAAGQAGPDFYVSFRWTPNGGVEALPMPPGALAESSYVAGISLDGSVIAGGLAYYPSGFQALRWQGDQVIELGDLLGGHEGSATTAISADGSTVIGWSLSVPGGEAFLWKDGTMIGLGDLSGGAYSSSATGVSADGSVVIGRGQTGTGQRAFVWTDEDGLLSLEALLLGYGLGPSLAGWTLESADFISADGRTIVGHGIGPSAEDRAWLVVIPEPASGVLLAGALVALSVLRRRTMPVPVAGGRD